ncbi:hypothetical protein QJS10_CPB20g02123 [Acorus calamus]|uniref:Uncharacterized protein n=1 Tax=Acorus calamus TaxID=4465 RepID=A0AAV9C8P3_ACOCL|nr:hypothetical protein QJS10_CPB20g02123 [Acorus calamus]
MVVEEEERTVAVVRLGEEESRDLLDCKFSLSGLNDNLYRISNSCDRLICVGREKAAYVINPTTKEFLELPSGTLHEKARYDRMACWVSSLMT